jgi:hypothetical protein
MAKKTLKKTLKNPVEAAVKASPKLQSQKKIFGMLLYIDHKMEMVEEQQEIQKM